MSSINIPQKILDFNEPQVTSVYIATLYLLPKNNVTNLITTDNIGYLYYGDKYTKDYAKEIDRALNYLCKNWTFEKFGEHKYLINWKRDFYIEPKSSYFATLDFEYYLKILNSKKRNRFVLIHHLCRMIYSLNSKLDFLDEDNHPVEKVVGTMPQAHFAKMYGVIPDTISGYNKALEELGLLYMIRLEYDPMTPYPISNIYSLTENKKYADMYMKKHGYKIRSQHTESSNYLRSIAQRYNRFIDYPEKRTQESARQLLEDIRIYNERHPERTKNPIVIELYLEGLPQEEIAKYIPQLTDVQKEAIELGLKTLQDFVGEPLANHNDLV